MVIDRQMMNRDLNWKSAKNFVPKFNIFFVLVSAMDFVQKIPFFLGNFISISSVLDGQESANDEWRFESEEYQEFCSKV